VEEAFEKSHGPHRAVEPNGDGGDTRSWIAIAVASRPCQLVFKS
jgi:hypothetical protein